MRITFIIQDLFVQGAQYATAQLVSGFVAKGYDVDLIVSKWHKYYAQTQKGWNEFKVPDSVRWIHLRNFRARQNVVEIRHYLKTTDSKAVICMSLNYSTAVRVAAFGLRHRPIIVHVEHGLPGYNVDGTIKNPPRRYSVQWLRKWIYWSGFDKVFTVSMRGKADFIRVNPMFDKDKVFVVYNPVVGKDFINKAAMVAKHKWLKPPSSAENNYSRPFTFVSAGVLADYKSQIYMLMAMKILKEWKCPCRLVIFGKGVYRETLERYISENELSECVDLPGVTDQLPAEMKAADCFVLSSEMESFGIVIVEALACGLPVISTDAPFGPREILEDGRFGTLVPVKDAPALAKAMSDAMHAGKAKPSDESWKRFTLESAVDRYEKALGL